MGPVRRLLTEGGYCLRKRESLQNKLCCLQTPILPSPVFFFFVLIDSNSLNRSISHGLLTSDCAKKSSDLGGNAKM